LICTGYSIATLAWAAPGKDPGFTPQLILDEITRNARFSRKEREVIATNEELDPVVLKRLFSDARDLFRQLPFETAGKVFLAPDGDIIPTSTKVARQPPVVFNSQAQMGRYPSQPRDARSSIQSQSPKTTISTMPAL
jgi:hypothetical protein